MDLIHRYAAGFTYLKGINRFSGTSYWAVSVPLWLPIALGCIAMAIVLMR